MVASQTRPCQSSENVTWTSATACSGFTTLTLALRKPLKMAFCNASWRSTESDDRFWNVIATADGEPARDCIIWTNSVAAAGREGVSCGTAEAPATKKNKNALSHRL